MKDEAALPFGPADDAAAVEEEVRVLLVNRRDVVRRGLRAVIEDADDLVVVAEMARLDEAWPMIDRTDPDVAILDATEPPEQIVSAVDMIRRVQINVPLLVNGRTDAEEAKRVAWAVGADGYLLDDADAQDVLQLVRRIARAETCTACRRCEVRVCRRTDPRPSTSRCASARYSVSSPPG
jgi:DNA-binding NarL/FixJ family response regulator